MAKLTLYVKLTCSTCRQVLDLVKQSGLEYQAIPYLEKPFSKGKLKQLLEKMGLPQESVLRTKEESYKKLKLKDKKLGLDQLVDLMLEHPELIQRPIVEKGNKVILARPAEKIKELL
jgi:arsenate reductase